MEKMPGQTAENTETTASPGAAPAIALSSPPTQRHTQISGRLNQYTSGYWALALPALSARYAFEAITNMAPPKFKNWYANSVGGFMLGVTSLYSWRTYKDMRNLFAEPLGWEFNKKPEEVGFQDILNSENLLVKKARSNFFNYNARRFGVNSTFFSPYVLPRSIAPSPDNAVKLGIAANALYLMSDVLRRKETFFERLQSFIDQKINHVDKVGDIITAPDLLNLYYRHTKDMDREFQHPRMNSREWKNDLVVFTRMAELMNQTYGNTELKEKADFTITKFMYLVGMELLDSEDPHKNLAYVEMANRHGNMAEVKRLVQEQAVTALPPRAEETVAAPEVQAATFTEKLAGQNHRKPLKFQDSIAAQAGGDALGISSP